MKKIFKNIILFVYNTIYPNEYYDDINTCPIRNYQRCFEEGDSRYLYKKYDKKLIDNLYHVLDLMTSNLIDDIGLNPLTEILFLKKKDLLKVQLNYIITENESFLNKITEFKNDIERIKKQLPVDDNIKESNARNNKILTQWLGFDCTTLSVFDYNVHLKDCAQSNKKGQREDVRRI